MSKKPPRFNIYLSYLPGEAPPKLLDTLVERLRNEYGDGAVFLSNSASELQKRVQDCHVLIHIFTEHSLTAPQCQAEIQFALEKQRTVFGVNMLRLEVDVLSFDRMFSPDDSGLDTLFQQLRQIWNVYDKLNQLQARYGDGELLLLLVDAHALASSVPRLQEKMQSLFEFGLLTFVPRTSSRDLEAKLNQITDRPFSEARNDLRRFEGLIALLNSIPRFDYSAFHPNLEAQVQATKQVLSRLEEAQHAADYGDIDRALQVLRGLPLRENIAQEAVRRLIAHLEEQQAELARIEHLNREWEHAIGVGDIPRAVAIFEQVPLVDDTPSLLHRFVILRPESREIMYLLRDSERLQLQGKDRDALPYLKEASTRIYNYGWNSSRMLRSLTHRIEEIERIERIKDAIRSAEVAAQSGQYREAEFRLIDLLRQTDLPPDLKTELEVLRAQMSRVYWLRDRQNSARRFRDELVTRRTTEHDRDQMVALDLRISDIEEELLSIEGEIDHLLKSTGFDIYPRYPQPSLWQDKPSQLVFTLFNPRQIRKFTRSSVVIYAHKQEEQIVIQKDVRRFSDELGEAPKERHSAEPIPLAPKTEITIVPEAEGIIFDPPELTKTWDEKWLRFNFDFVVPDTYKHEEIPLHISVQVKGFEVACIKSSCEVVAESAAETVSALPDDPLVDPSRESGTRKADAHLYRNVFLSYSHKDEEIAWRRARQIEQALGDRVFMDVKDLRAGDDWETRLFEWIDQADIIHLLWSENSAHSDYCRKEWTYALEKKCGNTRCFGVIRPVYWQKPMPEPPAELKHLHFQPIKLEE